MIAYERKELAARARMLISDLEACDEPDFIDMIVSCIESADTKPLDYILENGDY